LSGIVVAKYATDEYGRAGLYPEELGAENILVESPGAHQSALKHCTSAERISLLHPEIPPSAGLSSISKTDTP
jgi:hypothetical protein